ncbi:hypothetical protein E2C01_050399 [Portunus trituberculatus]|uniref:Uncharacterized protein n=1 Tax=Portunus trituberculatus TaxID=210409 RepID=A0A5B7GH76_PORTR|nr:hypothetical protein [Portunus trituberculatus]
MSAKSCYGNRLPPALSLLSLVVGRNRKLKYSRNRFLGRAEPLELVVEPVPRGISRVRLVNTEYQSYNTSTLFDEYHRRAGGSETDIHQPVESVPESFSLGNH